MSLYGGDQNNTNPYLNHALHHGGRLARNPVELQARSLPRPRKSRRKKHQEEKPLYPSIAAVEEAVPEAIISVQDNGTLDIRLPKEEEEEEAAMELDDAKPAATAAAASAAGGPTKEPQRVHKGSSSRSSASSSEKLDTAFRGLSLKRKPVASTPWPIDDDPLGGTALTLAPRRKVSRHASRDSNHSRTSASSGDSGGSNTHRHHRRTATFDSVESWSSSDSAETGPLDLKKPTKTSTHKSALSSSKSSSKHSKKGMIRRMKSWHDDEISAEKRAQELEIEPGLFLPLRGSDETLQAIKTGFVEEIFCQSCDIELICIADASYCVCPDCKCVSPVDGIACAIKSNKSAGSVGLGLRASSQR